MRFKVKIIYHITLYLYRIHLICFVSFSFQRATIQYGRRKKKYENPVQAKCFRELKIKHTIEQLNRIKSKLIERSHTKCMLNACVCTLNGISHFYSSTVVWYSLGRRGKEHPWMYNRTTGKRFILFSRGCLSMYERACVYKYLGIVKKDRLPCVNFTPKTIRVSFCLSGFGVVGYVSIRGIMY